MGLQAVAFQQAVITIPVQDTLRVIATDDQALAEFFDIVTSATETSLKPKVGNLRIQDTDDINLSDYLEFQVDDGSGFADILTPGAIPNPVRFNQVLAQLLPATQVAGTIFGSAFGALATLTGALTGFDIDLNTNIAINGQNLIGYRATLPAAYGAGTVYAIGATGGGYTFAGCLGGAGSGIAAAGYFADAVRGVSFANGVNAITVIAGISDLSVGALLIHHYSQAGDPAIAANEIAMWTDTAGPTYYLGANIPGVGVKKIAIT